MSRLHNVVAGCLLSLVLPSLAAAELPKKDRKAAVQRLSAGTLYLRIDAPVTQGRHPYGVYYSPIVEVSPTQVNTEAEDGASFGWYHASSTVWAVRVNDSVQYDDIEWDEDTAEIEFEGVGAADGNDTVIKFIGINSLADFNAAFDLAFSTQPLQDEHPDWPAEIRKAIAERKLVNGMTKRQAYYVVGTPAEVEKTTEDGKDIEIWTLRQKGMEIGFFTINPGDQGRPAGTLRFEDGKLISNSSKTNKLDLDGR